MTKEFEIRYFLEHKVLPATLYNEGVRLMAAVMGKGAKCIHDLYAKFISAIPGYPNPYTVDDFSVHSRTYIREEDRFMVTRIGMPEPSDALLCRAVYLCYGTRGGFELYVTSELLQEGGYCICGWSDDGHHMNFGDAPEDANDEMDMAADLFWRAVEYGQQKHKSVCGGQC